MNDLLKRLLSPDDDGRAFAEAVLLRASGALHQRRTTADGAGRAAWSWLEAWARPWLIAAIVGLALALALPVGRGPQSAGSTSPTLASDLMGTSAGTSYVLAETLGN